MKSTLNELFESLGVNELNFYPSTKSSRFVAYTPDTHTINAIVMTKETEVEVFDPEGDVYVTLLDYIEGEDDIKYKWIAEYNFACVVSNKPDKDPAFTLKRS